MTATSAQRMPLVAICMATFNPVAELLERQVDSIRSQSHSRFVCLVNDDASDAATFAMIEKVCGRDDRFVVSRNPERLGFYLNFERCLSRVPPEAPYVGFADQDDFWHADKLEKLLEALTTQSAALAYSDMNIVTPDGLLLAPSYWTERRNNFTSLESLLLTNSVTGAASFFRRELLDDALPFPPAAGHVYHDHWIACLALALDRIAFVAEPLHDYVQHDDNVVGFQVPLPADARGGLVNAFGRFVREPRRRMRNTVVNARRYYEQEVVSRESLAQQLEQRLAGRLAPDKAVAVRRVARMSSSPRSFLRLLARSARDVRGRSESAGIELQLVKGILWHWQHEARAELARANRRVSRSRA